MNSFKRYREIQKLLQECKKDTTKYGKDIKKLRQELKNINLRNDMVQFDTEVDLTTYIKWSNNNIHNMWKVFEENGKHVMIVLQNIFCVEWANIKKLEEQETNRPKNRITDHFDTVYIAGQNRERYYSKDPTEDRLIANISRQFSILQGFVLIHINNIIESIHKNTNPFQLERIIKIFARSLVRHKIIDANRMQTFYIIFSFGFAQNYIVTSYMIPAQIEYIFLKVLKENGKSIAGVAEDGKILDDINLQAIMNDENHLNTLKKYIDSNILDEFKYLFKHNNIRNDIYHGKCGDDVRSLGYLWYQFCKMIYKIFLSKMNDNGGG